MVLGATFGLIAAPAIPNDSWERWITELRANRLDPQRPDGKKNSDQLPLWVDCFLGTLIDRGQVPARNDLTLVGSESSCRGQVLEWK